MDAIDPRHALPLTRLQRLAVRAPDLALACLLLTANPAAAADTLYKWVDCDGTVTYSSTPPPAGAPAEELKIAPPPSDEAVREAAERAQRAAERARELEAQRAREAADEAAEAARRRAAQPPPPVIVEVPVYVPQPIYYYPPILRPPRPPVRPPHPPAPPPFPPPFPPPAPMPR
jgi:hypothetical protein